MGPPTIVSSNYSVEELYDHPKEDYTKALLAAAE